MGKLYCLMGKSASGKDSIYKGLMADGGLALRRIVPYTTRPVRAGETPGQDYVFCDEEKLNELDASNRIIEMRTYHTVAGEWKYFTVDDGNIDLDNFSYLYIVTLEGYEKILKYFGEGHIVPIYIEVEDGERLMRAIERERAQAEPAYEEMCRRFLADAADFSPENLRRANVTRTFFNKSLEQTIKEISEFIAREELQK